MKYENLLKLFGDAIAAGFAALRNETPSPKYLQRRGISLDI
jgi:hypothetical protein